MQQRGYHVQILPLVSTASASAAQHVLRYLPTPNATAYQLVVNVRAILLKPFGLPGCPKGLPSWMGHCERAWLTIAAISTNTNLGVLQMLWAYASSTCRSSIAQVTGPAIAPLNVQKQTAMLSVMARNFPRLAFGVGPQQSRIVAVTDTINESSAAVSNTATVTIITVSDGSPQQFAEARRIC